MCRNIRPLFNFEPPAGESDVRDAALQFVRKISGTHKPSRVNQEVFDRAIDEVTESCQRLLGALVTTVPPRNRLELEEKAKEKSRRRFGGEAGQTS